MKGFLTNPDSNLTKLVYIIIITSIIHHFIKLKIKEKQQVVDLVQGTPGRYFAGQETGFRYENQDILHMYQLKLHM